MKRVPNRVDVADRTDLKVLAGANRICISSERSVLRKPKPLLRSNYRPRIGHYVRVWKAGAICQAHAPRPIFFMLRPEPRHPIGRPYFVFLVSDVSALREKQPVWFAFVRQFRPDRIH